MKDPVYPFVPRSATALTPGQFWGVPLRDGTFACGRVVQAVSRHEGASRVLFLAALLDWHSPSPPSAESIAGARCVAQGKTHVKCIRETGGQVLGHRPLALDAIEPALHRSGLGDPANEVLLGLTPVRRQTAQDQHLPTLSLWGYAYIRALAETRFLTPGAGA